MNRLEPLAIATGALSIVVGVALMSVPAAFVVGGVAIIALALDLPARRPR